MAIICDNEAIYSGSKCPINTKACLQAVIYAFDRTMTPTEMETLSTWQDDFQLGYHNGGGLFISGQEPNGTENTQNKQETASGIKFPTYKTPGNKSITVVGGSTFLHNQLAKLNGKTAYVYFIDIDGGIGHTCAGVGEPLHPVKCIIDTVKGGGSDMNTVGQTLITFEYSNVKAVEETMYFANSEYFDTPFDIENDFYGLTPIQTFENTAETSDTDVIYFSVRTVANKKGFLGDESGAIVTGITAADCAFTGSVTPVITPTTVVETPAESGNYVATFTTSIAEQTVTLSLVAPSAMVIKEVVQTSAGTVAVVDAV